LFLQLASEYSNTSQQAGGFLNARFVKHHEAGQTVKEAFDHACLDRFAGFTMIKITMN
jgi:hypothetical protein